MTRPPTGPAGARARRQSLDLRCYLVTSGTDRHTVETAAAAAAAGAGIVQVRAKELEARELLDLVIAVARAVSAVAPACRVLVDDRADVAFAAASRGERVHGVHLGQGDLPVTDARTLLGSRAIIGLTTGTLDLVRAAEEQTELLDYVGAGPFRPTPTKDSGRAPLGVDGYRELLAATRLPIVAIGDVTPDDVPALAGTGIAGAALVRAIMAADDPAGAVREVLAGFTPPTSRRRTRARRR
ncbi:thiamine phosphate synthase [Brachybacterium halotolerans subsp. kimchii]|uniref:thiamine phosphate synthase n=1 Tax=Brachybacterium halotolerans TaxID=2795215 RepID=UPI001E3F99D4|nr:thiamine phosphate synthase [Brachybacterium halotolerans]UEJ82830.1 thiamine phosphate synthase [Brachybacterium halotolerans subsp. kimchii]